MLDLNVGVGAVRRKDSWQFIRLQTENHWQSLSPGPRVEQEPYFKEDTMSNKLAVKIIIRTTFWRSPACFPLHLNIMFYRKHMAISIYWNLSALINNCTLSACMPLFWFEIQILLRGRTSVQRSLSEHFWRCGCARSVSIAHFQHGGFY